MFTTLIEAINSTQLILSHKINNAMIITSEGDINQGVNQKMTIF